MKFTLFALIAGLCLVAVTANATGSLDSLEYVPQDFADEVMDFETTGIFFNFYFVLKAALRTVKGLNCTIKEVLRLETVSVNFLNDLHNCGGEVAAKVQKLINAVNDIIETCKAIIGINESVCGNTTPDEDETAAQTLGAVSAIKTSHKCAVNMFRKVMTLKKQVKYAIKLIKQIQKVPGDINDCTMNAINTLGSYFTQFPANIKACSKLTS